MKNSILKKSEGFTLIEVMIGVVILAVGLLALVTMQTTAMKGNASANRISQESNTGADHIERLFGLNWTHAELADVKNPKGTAGLDQIGANADGTKTTPDGLYTISWNVADDTPMPGLKKLRVIITKTQGNTPPVVMNYIRSNES